jgi:hypothetical protein
MSLKYAQIPAEDVVFREQFINNQYVADNGVTLTDVAVSNGGTFNGTTSKADTGCDCIGVGDMSIEMFVTVVGYGEANTGYLVCNDQFAIVTNDTNDTLNVTSNFFGNSANAANDSIKTGNTYHIVVTRPASGDTTIYIDGAVSGSPASSGTPVAGSTNVIIGNRNNGTRTTNGIIHFTTIYNRVLTAGEVSDKYTQRTFKEPTPEQSEVWLPLRTYYNDGSNDVTPNLGLIGQDEVKWGDGSTATTYPTLLENNGVYLAGGANSDYVTCGTLAIAATYSYTFCALVQSIGSAGNDYIYSHRNNSTFNGTFAYQNGANLTYGFDNDAARVNTMTDRGDNAGLYHFAMTVELSGANHILKGYIDGELVQTKVCPNITAEANAVLTIGADTAFIQGWQGNMFFPIYMKQALTPTQIKWLSDYSYRQLNI